MKYRNISFDISVIWKFDIFRGISYCLYIFIICIIILNQNLNNYLRFSSERKTNWNSIWFTTVNIRRIWLSYYILSTIFSQNVMNFSLQKTAETIENSQCIGANKLLYSKQYCKMLEDWNVNHSSVTIFSRIEFKW